MPICTDVCVFEMALPGEWMYLSYSVELDAVISHKTRVSADVHVAKHTPSAAAQGPLGAVAIVTLVPIRLEPSLFLTFTIF